MSRGAHGVKKSAVKPSPRNALLLLMLAPLGRNTTTKHGTLPQRGQDLVHGRPLSGRGRDQKL